MTFKEYQSLASRTLPIFGKDLDLLHCSLGMSSELYELFQSGDIISNFLEEVGDICWYWAGLYTLLEIPTDEITDRVSEVISPFSDVQLVHDISKLEDTIKKHVYYKKDLNLEDVKNLLQNIKASLIAVAADNNLPISIILEANINKLNVRYPEKFTIENANNRDLKTEQTTLVNATNTTNHSNEKKS
jgi:hypothetical protein